MRRLALALALVLLSTAAVAQISAPGPNSALRRGAVWTVATVVLNGGSQTLLAAGTGTCHSVSVYNPTGNAAIYIDLSGGTVASETGIKVAPGTWFSDVAAMATCKALTGIGTNTQSIYVWSAS